MMRSLCHSLFDLSLGRLHLNGHWIVRRGANVLGWDVNLH